MENRKKLRLPDYDYSSNGYYFITICVKDNKCIFWDKKQNENMYIVGANRVRQPCVLHTVERNAFKFKNTDKK